MVFHNPCLVRRDPLDNIHGPKGPVIDHGKGGGLQNGRIAGSNLLFVIKLYLPTPLTPLIKDRSLTKDR